MAAKLRDGLARAPLLDRLIDLQPDQPGEPSEERSFRTLEPERLRESVRLEVQRLLNTRASIGAEALETAERSVVNYGVPDLSEFDPANATDRQRICSLLRATVSAFEPRLRQVEVEVEEAGDRTLVVRIDAVLAIDQVREPISFRVPLGEAAVKRGRR